MANTLQKIIAFIVPLIMLFSAGCSTADDSVDTIVADDNNDKQQEPAEHYTDISNSAEQVIWIAEPQFAFTGIKEFSPYINYSGTGVCKELIGYTDEWEKNGSPIRMIYYTGDAIEVIQGNKSGVFDYSGNELYPVSIKRQALRPRANDSNAIIFTFLHYVLNGNGDLAFSDDFKSVGPYQASTEYTFLLMEYLRYHNGKLEKYNALDNTFTEGVYKENAYGIVRESDDNDNALGHVIVDDQGNFVARVQGDHTEEAWIVNKMLIVQKDGKYAYQSAITGELITDFIYDSAKEFMDGYAPVEKNGKWGFINSEGTEVTDFIFDDASRLYKGNAYVSVDGVYGVLNIIDNLNRGIRICAETCTVDPAVIANVAREKEGMLIPIGKATVLVDNLNVRTAPTVEADLAAEKHSIPNGRVFDVYGIEKTDGYTWYQIDDEMWIANDGSWVDYNEYE